MADVPRCRERIACVSHCLFWCGICQILLEKNKIAPNFVPYSSVITLFRTFLKMVEFHTSIWLFLSQLRFFDSFAQARFMAWNVSLNFFCLSDFEQTIVALIWHRLPVSLLETHGDVGQKNFEACKKPHLNWIKVCVSTHNYFFR